MFGFGRDKKNDFAAVIAEKQSYLTTLATIKQLLSNTENNAQSEFIQELVELINNNHIDSFVSLINGVDMWGGSGAVWEVFIENKLEAREFESNMLKLIELLDKTKIMGKGIVPIKKIFEENLKAE